MATTGAVRHYSEEVAEGPELPLLDYAAQEIQRLAKDIAEQNRQLHVFVDNICGPPPMVLNSSSSVAGSAFLGANTITTSTTKSPNRGEALREAIRYLQQVRNDSAEGVSRLGAI